MITGQQIDAIAREAKQGRPEVKRFLLAIERAGFLVITEEEQGKLIDRIAELEEENGSMEMTIEKLEEEVSSED